MNEMAPMLIKGFLEILATYSVDCVYTHIDTDTGDFHMMIPMEDVAKLIRCQEKKTEYAENEYRKAKLGLSTLRSVMDFSPDADCIRRSNEQMDEEEYPPF